VFEKLAVWAAPEPPGGRWIAVRRPWLGPGLLCSIASPWGSFAVHGREFYPAHHGFAVPDNATYDTEADARHWEALHELYRAHLQGS
jgi:dienelactone hydrolase